VKAKL